MNKMLLVLYLHYAGFLIMGAVYFYFFLDYGKEMWPPEILPGMLLFVGALIFFWMAGITARLIQSNRDKNSYQNKDTLKYSDRNN